MYASCLYSHFCGAELRELFFVEIVKKGGKKKACKVVKTLRQALAEILAAVVGAVIAEAVCRLIFG